MPSPNTAVSLAQAPSCLEEGVPRKPSEVDHFSGTVAYWDYDRQAYLAYDGISLQTVTLNVPIDGHSSRLLDFSPNGERLGYYESLTPTVGFLTPDGRQIEHLLNYAELFAQAPEPGMLSSWGNHAWVNDDLLQITANYRENEDTPRTRSFSVFADVAQGRWQPDIVAELPTRLPWAAVALSPDLTRVLYVEGTWKSIADDSRLVLWDRENRSALWSSSDPVNANFLDASYSLMALAWSPNSKRLAYIGPEVVTATLNSGVHILDRDGKVHSLITDFSSRSKAFESNGLRWSPDGRFLAFSAAQMQPASDYEIAGRELYIYDTAIDKYVLRCPLTGEEYIPYRLHWSLDSRYIAYTLPALIVIDIKTGAVFKLADRADVIGWEPAAFTVWHTR
jgi:hypothetical protein